MRPMPSHDSRLVALTCAKGLDHVRRIGFPVAVSDGAGPGLTSLVNPGQRSVTWLRGEVLMNAWPPRPPEHDFHAKAPYD